MGTHGFGRTVADQGGHPDPSGRGGSLTLLPSAAVSRTSPRLMANSSHRVGRLRRPEALAAPNEPFTASGT